MRCAEKNALLQAYRAAVDQYRAIAEDRGLSRTKRDEKLEDANADCERRRRTLHLHSEEHGC